ncbi:MAG TPA: CHRD domain-containing protein [Blastocatellia bacterium]|nr:CHRD domain-containing protein [Blastocatellia bacterium]
MSGYNVVPTLSTGASGEFSARISKDGTQISYELSYSGFITTVVQAHIHLGRTATNGGVIAFLCTNVGNGPAGTPACPPTSGTVTGTLTASSVIGPFAQGIAPGEFAELVRAIRAGATYADVASVNFPGGEIRDQIDLAKGRKDEE